MLHILEDSAVGDAFPALQKDAALREKLRSCYREAKRENMSDKRRTSTTSLSVAGGKIARTVCCTYVRENIPRKPGAKVDVIKVRRRVKRD